MKPPGAPPDEVRHRSPSAAPFLVVLAFHATVLYFYEFVPQGWGFDHYRRAMPLELWLAAAAALLGAACVHQRPVAARLMKIKIPGFTWLRCAIVLVALLYVFREQRLSGDWIAYGYRPSMGPDWLFWKTIYWLAPLSHVLYFVGWSVFDLFAGEYVLPVSQLMLTCWGAALLATIWWTGREVGGGGRRAAWLWVLSFVATGLITYCLGHVESYPISMSVLGMACALNVRAITRGSGIVAASVALGAAVMAHPQNASFLPSTLVVLWCCRGEYRPAQLVAAWAGGLAAFPIALWLLAKLLGNTGGAQDMTTGGLEYVILPAIDFFTTLRRDDLINMMARLLPALPMMLVAMVWWRRRLTTRDPLGWWFGFNGAAGLCYALFVWNKMSMELDWDLAGPAVMMLWMWCMYVVWRGAPAGHRIQTILAIIALMLPHTLLLAGWLRTPDTAQQAEITYFENQARDIRRGMSMQEIEPRFIPRSVPRDNVRYGQPSTQSEDLGPPRPSHQQDRD